MKRHLCTLAAVGALLVVVSAPGGAFAQKSGGILRIPHGDSPASMSTHDEATRSTATPMMGVFNNLVIFDQHVPQNTLGSIVPDLAVAWSWDEDKTALTFHLRQDVRWHDGRPFTATRREVHLGPAHRQVQREAAGQPTQIMVPKSRGGERRQRQPGHLPSEASRSPSSRRLLASGASPVYPLPCVAGADAAASDRHGPIQVR